ncbi:MAG TPA: hypothetical protein VKZ77_13870 [Bacillaceae bacterium]|nr:hypothetical protein [Paenibacillus bovis]HLU23548.1 hypothetical protein [Bacillaceae bacterium]
MIVVHFIENRNVLLTQLRKTVPTAGENIRIKGRNGIVVDIKKIKDNVVHVNVNMASITRKNVLMDSKKKRR